MNRDRPTPARQLAAFLAKYDPSIAAIAKGALSRMRKRLPGAVELVYDNYNALVIAFSPSSRASEALFSIAVYPRWVNVFFAQGARLADPGKLLEGSGTKMRHIVLKQAADLQSKEIEALIASALALADHPIDPQQRHQLLIKAVAAKQRPRRPS